MSRTRRYLSGLLGNYLNQAVVLALGLWLTRFLLGRVGQEQYGTWLIVLQALTFLELTDLGVMSLVPREVAYLTGRAGGARAGAVGALLDGVRRLALWQLPLVGAAAAALWLLLLGGRLDHPATLPLAAAALCYVALFPVRLYAAALSGLQDLFFTGVANTAVWLAQAAATVALVLAGAGLWALVGGWAVGRCLLPLLCRWRLGRAFPDVPPPHLLGRPGGDAGRLLRGGLWVSLSGLAVNLVFGADVLILGWLLGPAAVVVYACTAKLTTLCAHHVTALATGAGPALSELREGGSGERLSRASTALGQLVLLASGLLACVILACNEGFVSWWVGAERYGGAGLTALLMGAVLARHLSFTFAHTLVCLGQERNVCLVVLADGLVVVAGMVVFVPRWGALGAPLGSLLGVGLVSLPLLGALLARRPGFSVGALLRAYAPWAWRFAAVAAGLVGLGTVWVPSGLVGLALTASAVSAAYAAVMLPAVVGTPLWVFLGPRLALLRRPFGKAAPAAVGPGGE